MVTGPQYLVYCGVAPGVADREVAAIRRRRRDLRCSDGVRSSSGSASTYDARMHAITPQSRTERQRRDGERQRETEREKKRKKKERNRRKWAQSEIEHARAARG